MTDATRIERPDGTVFPVVFRAHAEGFIAEGPFKGMSASGYSMQEAAEGLAAACGGSVVQPHRRTEAERRVRTETLEGVREWLTKAGMTIELAREKCEASLREPLRWKSIQNHDTISIIDAMLCNGPGMLAVTGEAHEELCVETDSTKATLQAWCAQHHVALAGARDARPDLRIMPWQIEPAEQTQAPLAEHAQGADPPATHAVAAQRSPAVWHEPPPPSLTMRVLGEVNSMRADQDKQWGVQNHPFAIAGMKYEIKNAQASCRLRFSRGEGAWADILLEEVAEALEAMHDGHVSGTREELIDVAAVAVAMIEQIDRMRAASLDDAQRALLKRLEEEPLRFGTEDVDFDTNVAAAEVLNECGLIDAEPWETVWPPGGENGFDATITEAGRAVLAALELVGAGP